MWVTDLNSIMVCIAVFSVVKARNYGYRKNLRSDLRSENNSSGDCNIANLNIQPLNSNSIHDDNNKNQNATVNEVPSERPRKRCCPYDFDSTICRIIDDRVLCGFNKNVGNPKSKNKALDLAGGCRMRGGRLECGYVHAPFTNSRRPPVWYNNGSQEEGDKVLADTDIGEKSMLKKKLTTLATGVIYQQRATRCVEINYRIICQDM